MDREPTSQSSRPAQPTRRQVLRGAGAGVGAAALAPALASPALAGTQVARQGGPQAEPTGRSLDFNLGWKFALVTANGVTDPTGAYANAYQPGFDDSGWRPLDLPHDWSIELDPVDNGNTVSGSGFFPGGLGWYRKTFTLPPSMSGRRISVEFDGVYMNANVYLNGKLLGNHPYAYTGFNYDLTGQVHTDGRTPNVIAVQASNQIPSSRWYSGSGIYRNVHLVITGLVHVARHGTFVTTPDLSSTAGAGYGNVQIQTIVQNDGAVPVPATVAVRVRDAHGAVAGSASATVSVPAGQTATATSAVRVDHPALWSVDDPALYSVETDVLTRGMVVDSITVPFGFRYFAFDPDQGFSLNGRHMKLQGVDLHATQGPLGAVIRPDALRRQMTIMKSMGVNALRTAHNPPAPELTAVCERLGILMMVEAFDCWHTGKLPYDYHLYFDAWSDSDIKEMVNAHKNSPAVVLWSIGNETPDTGRTGGPAIAQRLIADVKSVDTTRPVVMGSDRYRSVPRDGSPQDQIVRMLDGLGVNYNTAMSMDGLHAKYGTKFFFCSEMGSETSTRGFYQDPQLLNTGENYTPGKCNTSSYDNNLSSWCMSGEYELKKDRDRLFWAGGFLWSGQDYIGEPTPYNQFPVKASFFGAVDTAGFPKDAFFLFGSQWDARPMVHLVPMNWTDHAVGQDVAVWVYANVETVELQLNGRSLGTKSFDRKVTTSGRSYLETTEPTNDDYNYPSGSYTSPNGSTGQLHLTWNVPFEPGTLVAIARRGGAEVARDVVVTAGRPRAVRLTPDTRLLTADGISLSFVTAEIVDARGVVVPGADQVMDLSVRGAGRLAGNDNGRQENAAGYQSPSVAAFNGKAVIIVQSVQQPGPIRLTATSPGLMPGTASLYSAPARDSRPAIGGAAVAGGAAGAAASPAAPPAGPTADASFSGAPNTLPAMMLDGNLSTAWSNYYAKVATANVKAVSVSHASDWVSVSWPKPQRFAEIKAFFTTGGPLALPASMTVSYWDGRAFVPARNLHVTLAAASNQATTLTFDPVATREVRLTMTSPAPGTASGFLQIAELQVVTSG
jgi:beta-galactosidase